MTWVNEKKIVCPFVKGGSISWKSWIRLACILWRRRAMITQISRIFAGFILGLMVIGSPLAQAEDVADDVQNVVISYQQDPTEEAGLEAACVALQLGTGMLLSGAKVTIFATLDGVYLADEGTYEDVEKGKKGKKGKKGRRGNHDDDDGPICETYIEGVLGDKPLRDILDGFLNAEGEVLLCPLCLAARQDGDYVLIDDPSIYVGNPISLLLNADKVIDY
jgi:predicted peroxiredoxin